MKEIVEGVYHIGVDDHEIDLFEGQYIVPRGMAYNSYLIKDDTVAVLDTADRHFADIWLSRLDEALAGRKPDCLIIHHMEPDHSGSIAKLLDKYPDTKIVATDKAHKMFSQFLRDRNIPDGQKIVAGAGTELSLGKHILKFYPAPMVHWPEVMMSFDETSGCLFSADAFGKFGAGDTIDPEGWACEARRYYFGIVGRYGAQVQGVLKKLSGLDIRHICPLHGPVLSENPEYYFQTYDTWSSFRPEDRGVLIAYTSVYGHTEEAAKLLEKLLRERGEAHVAVADLARDDWAETVEDAFRYDRMVIATTTYNGDMFPSMKFFVDALTERGYRDRTVGIIENGTWAPQAAKRVLDAFSGLKNIRFLSTVTIMSSMSEENRKEIAALADELVGQK